MLGAGCYTPSDSKRCNQQQRPQYKRRTRQVEIPVAADRQREHLREQDRRGHVGDPVHAAVGALQLTLFRRADLTRHQALQCRIRQAVQRRTGDAEHEPGAGRREPVDRHAGGARKKADRQRLSLAEERRPACRPARLAR